MKLGLSATARMQLLERRIARLLPLVLAALDELRHFHPERREAALQSLGRFYRPALDYLALNAERLPATARDFQAVATSPSPMTQTTSPDENGAGLHGEQEVHLPES